MRFKICKIAEPNDMYTYDQRYFSVTEMGEILDNMEFLIEFLRRKKKKLDKIEGLKRSYEKMKELML